MIISNATISWPHLVTPSTKFNVDGTYEVRAEISDSDAQELRDMGVSVKSEEGVNIVNLRKKAKNKNGEAQKAPQVVTADLTAMTSEQISKIGNGTKANLRIRTYDWNFGGKSGTSAVLEGVQVTQLVEYDRGDAEAFEAVETSAIMSDESSDGMY